MITNQSIDLFVFGSVNEQGKFYNSRCSLTGGAKANLAIDAIFRESTPI